jgi:predicted dehydrogenase
MTGFHMRFHRLVKRARERIVRDDLGRIESIRVIWHSPRRDEGIAAWKVHRDTGGGALVEIGVHHFDLIRFLLGSEFEWVYAASRNGTREDESAVISGRMSDGALFTGEFSERSSHEIEFVVSGSLGWLRVDCLKFEGIQYRTYYEVPGDPSVRLRSFLTFAQSLPMGVYSMHRGGDYRISYEESWKHFIGCIRDGIRPSATFEDGLRAVEAVNAALESARTCRPQQVRRAELGR